jgi:microsomal dipeptidase-like Zn-dependent dipeptidase
MVRNAREDCEDEKFRINGFLGWSINLCDEDVIEIHRSRGMIGLAFDQRLLGGDRLLWLIQLAPKALARRQAMALFGNTLEQFVRIPFEYHLEDPLRIWDEICIGSGFDGLTNPITRYPTVLQFKIFEEDLIEILEKMKREHPLWLGGRNPVELARKICFDNALNFVVREYK